MRTYAPDNVAVEIRTCENGLDGIAPPEEITGLVKEISLRMAAEGMAVEVGAAFATSPASPAGSRPGR